MNTPAPPIPTQLAVRVCSRCYWVRAAHEGFCPACKNPEFEVMTVSGDEWLCTFCRHRGTLDDFSDAFQEPEEQPRYYCETGGHHARVVTLYSLLPSPQTKPVQKRLFQTGATQ